MPRTWSPWHTAVGGFLHKFLHKEGRTAERLHREVWDAFQAYLWPGNVRELHNVIRFAVMMCRGVEILPAHLPVKLRVALSQNRSPVAPPRGSAVHIATFAAAPPPGRNGKAVPSMDDLVEQAERFGIECALKAFGGSVAQAAKALGRSRRWIEVRMRKLGLNRKEFLPGNGKAGAEPP